MSGIFGNVESVFDDDGPTYAVLMMSDITTKKGRDEHIYKFIRKSVPSDTKALALAYSTLKKKNDMEVFIYKNQGNTYEEQYSKLIYRVIKNAKGEIIAVTYIRDKKRTEEWAKNGRRDVKVNTCIGSPAYLIDEKGHKTKTANPFKENPKYKDWI